MKILYVEDEIAHVMLTERTLEENLHQEFHVIHAETISGAIKILDSQPDIDVVLTDLRLPDGTGLELLRKIRERNAPPAVVLVTGQGDQEMAVAALKAGAADYLVKQADYLHRLPVVLSNAVAHNRYLREQEALRLAEVRYQALIEQISAVVFLEQANEAQTLLYLSPRILELTGYTAEEWQREPRVRALALHPDDRERVLEKDREAARSGSHFEEEYRIVRRDGSIVWVKEDANPICDRQGTPLYWQGILLDITHEKQNESALQRQLEEIAVLHSAALAASNSLQIDQLIEQITHVIGESLYPDNFGIMLLEEETRSLKPHASYRGTTPEILSRSYPVTEGVAGKVVRTASPIRLEDVASEPAFIEVTDGVRSELCVPIISRGRIIGVINTESRRPAAYSERDERLLITIANTLATAMDKLHSFEEARQRATELEALYRASRSLTLSLEPEIIGRNLIQTIGELLDYEFVSVYLLEEQTRLLVPVAVRQKAHDPVELPGSEPALLQEKLSLGTGTIGWVAQNGQPLRTGEVATDQRYLAVVGHVQSELCLPLMARGKAIGVLNIESTRPHAYTERDQSVLTALANSAAIAFENARLYKSELARRQQAEALRAATASLSTAMDLRSLYPIILEAVATLIPYDRGSIEIMNQGCLETVTEHGFLPSDSLLGQKHGWNASAWGSWEDLWRRADRSMIQSEAQTADWLVDRGSADRPHSRMAVPMIVGKNVLGLISLEAQKPNAYTEEHAAVAQTIANQAAIAIEKAQLYEDALRAAERRAVLHRISQDIVRFSQNPEQIYTAIQEAAVKLMPCDVFSIVLRDEKNGQNVSVCTIEGGKRFERDHSPGNTGLSDSVIDEGRSIILRSKMEISQRQRMPLGSPEQVQSVVAVPLRIGEQIIGMISAQSYRPYAYDSEEQVLLEMLATHAATAIENGRLFEEQGRRARIIETLADIANEIATTREVIPALDRITQRALDLLHANDVAIYLLEDDNVHLKTVTAYGDYRNEFLGHTLRVGEGITGNVFLNAKPEIISDTAEDARRAIVPGTPSREQKLESLMSSPLILRGKPIGVINAWRLKENGLFTESELNFLVGIAHQASICIESGKLLQETQRQAQEAAAIAEVGRDVSATLQLDVVMERIASYAMNLLHGESSALYLADASGSTLHAIAAVGVEAEAIKNDPLEMGLGILGNIAQQNVGEIVNDTLNDPRMILVKGTESVALEHIMGVPILLKDRHMGLLAVWRSGNGTEFAPRELQFLTSLARQAAVAIENARLYDEAQRRLKELETINRVSTALRMAQSIKEMLPMLLNEALKLVNTTHGSIWLYDHSSDRLVQQLASGMETGLAYTSMPLMEGIVGYAFRTAKTYFSPELKSDPLLFEGNRETVPSGLGGVYVPIQSTAGPVGVLIAEVETGRSIPDEINLLTILAEITGNSIHRAQLYDQSQRQVRRLTSLRDIDAAIASSFDLRLTLNILMDQTISHLSVDAVNIGLFYPDLQILSYLPGIGFNIPSATRPQLRVGEGLAGQVILKQQTCHITNLQNAPEARNEVLLKRENFVTYIGIPLIVKGQTKGVFEVFHRTSLSPTPDWMDFLHTLAGQAAIAIDNSQLFEKLQRSNQELIQAYDTTLEGWARALELRDRETEGHTRRVTELTMRLARYMHVSESEMVNIHRGVLLHDIGKMGVPDHILKKTGKLTEEEWAEMRLHPVYAYNLLAPISFLRAALDIPYCHHEHWDGHGYPRGLKGELIPLAARIFAVVDNWDALRSNRPYRKAWLRADVIDYLRQNAGVVFDPRIVDIFLAMIDKEDDETG